MQLAVTLHKLPRETNTLRDALSRMGKSYQDYNEGLGFIEAGRLYGSLDSFLELFSSDENLTLITPVVRLLRVITDCKWKVTIESDDSVEDRAKLMLSSFRKRVIDQKSMKKVSDWIESRGNLQKVTEDELHELLYVELPAPDDDDADLEPIRVPPSAFKPPNPLNEVPDKLSIRNEKLQRKMELADQYDSALDKEFFYQQHGKYNVLIGRALGTVCEAYRYRGWYGST